ncbi:hypothetical protein [Luteimonas saliphila]|uniref:hypothetical protein n=1 Tax=Luteimonas saliphila TaxID=2804919 RepID=UPI00192D3328|nr:hypothetical protein [Luteimonas saliphila]
MITAAGRETLEKVAFPVRDPGKSKLPTLLRQQRRRARFIELNRLSPREVADHIAWDYDPGPEYD